MRIILFIILCSVNVSLYATPPYIVKDKIQQMINEDIYYKLNKTDKKIIKEVETTKTSMVSADNVITFPLYNLFYSNVQDNLYELDENKLHRKQAISTEYNTMRADFIMGDTYNIGVGTATPNFPIDIYRQAPQIMIRNSLGGYPFAISVPKSTEPKGFNILEYGVKTWIKLAPPENMIFLNNKLALGTITDTAKYFEKQNYGVSFSSGFNVAGKELYLGNLDRKFSDDDTNYEIDLSTSLNIIGKLNVKDYTTISSFTASGYGIIQGTMTIIKDLTVNASVYVYGIIYGTNTYSQTSGTSTYSINSGTSIYSSQSGTSTYSAYSSNSDKLDGYHYTAFVDTWTDQSLIGGQKEFTSQIQAVGGLSTTILQIFGHIDMDTQKIINLDYDNSGIVSTHTAQTITGQKTFTNTVFVSTIIFTQIYEMTPISVPAGVSTGTVYMDTNYDINVCTAVVGATRYWGKLKYE